MAHALPEYVSDSSSDEEVAQPHSSKRLFANYIHRQKFGSLVEAKLEVHSQKSWYERRTVSHENDKRIYYDCKWSRKCPSKMMLIMPHTCSDVYQHVSDGDHNHELTPTGLPDATKQAVSELFLLGVTKPNAILKALRAKGVCTPPKKKLNHYLPKLRADNSKIQNLIKGYL